MLSIKIIFYLFLTLPFGLSQDLVTSTAVFQQKAAVTNSAELLNANSLAASADYEFILTFLQNLDVNMKSYISYMDDNHLTLPQKVINYYYHLAAIPSSIDLTSDLAKEFPFTEFQTFITNFPWYTSLLSDASATTIFLPEYFIENSGSEIYENTDASTQGMNTFAADSFQSSSAINEHNGSLNSSTISSFKTSSVSSYSSTSKTNSTSKFSSSNVANSTQLKFPVILVLVLGLFL